QSELGAFRPQDLQQAPSGREPHARDPEAVPEAHTDRGGGEAFLVQTENRLLDVGLLHRDPLRVRREKRPRGSALSFAMCMEASHHFLGRGCAYRGDPFKIDLARATPMMRTVLRDTGWNPCFPFVWPKDPNMHMATSNLSPSRKERMSARTNPGRGRKVAPFFRARESISRDRSIPVTRYPRRASGRSWLPVPHPRSRTVFGSMWNLWKTFSRKSTSPS